MPTFVHEDGALIWRGDGETLRLEPWNEDGIRVRATLAPAIRDDLPQALLHRRLAHGEVTITDAGARLRSGDLEARVKPNGEIGFHRVSTGEVVLAERRPYVYGPIAARGLRHAEGDLQSLDVVFGADPEERIYGLGQHHNGRLDQRGGTFTLAQQNGEIGIPFYYSSKNYGFLWNHPGTGRVELNLDRTRWIADAAWQMDYWIVVGDSPRTIMRRYAEATGHPTKLPDWALGFWQCKLRYRTQEELLAVAREHTARGLPMSVIVADFFHWSMQGDWKFDPDEWPDPAAMCRELAEMGIKLMVSIWPTVHPHSENTPDLRDRGLLVRARSGQPVFNAFTEKNAPGTVFMHYCDATNPAARQFLWETCKRNYHDKGVALFWLDANEPEIYPRDHHNLRYHAGPGAAVTNIFPLCQAQAFYEGMKAAGVETPVNLCRSAWAGSQRYGAAVWSGDVPSSFASLGWNIRAGLNMAMSGIPWWTTDIGGFHGGHPDDPEFRELIVRWFQYGAFCPLFRLHGNREPVTYQARIPMTGNANEVWSFGEEAYAIIKELLFLRERLRPYLLQQMETTHATGDPVMRPVFFDFPDDAHTAEVDDAYMFGPDYLVAPVYAYHARSRDVYLPRGARWTNAWTGETRYGGETITVPAPLDQIPLFIRDDATNPLSP